MSELTIITATLGRDSLIKVAECVRNQTVPVKWLICCDGDEAYDRVQYMGFVGDPAIHKTPGAAQGPNSQQVMFRHASLIDSPYVCFMDDDNLFNNEHCSALLNALKDGHPFVSTRRLYTTPKMQPCAAEHPQSELIDTNCSAMTTELFKRCAAALQTANFMVVDRHVQGFLLSLGIQPHILADRYTVLYKMGTGMKLENFAGQVLFETLTGMVLKMGKWDQCPTIYAD